MPATIEELTREIQELQAKLEYAEEALRAIQRGEVDALVIYTDEGEHIYTLEGADYTYRVMIENISEGVATLQQDGVVLYANQRLAQMLASPLETVLGSELVRFVKPEDKQSYEALLRRSRSNSSLGELSLQRSDGVDLPVLISLSGVENKGESFTCGVITDLGPQKATEEILAAEILARSVLEQASEAILVCDLNRIVIRASRSVSSLTRENPLLQPFDRLFSLSIIGDGSRDAADVLKDVFLGKSFRGLEARLDNGLIVSDLLFSAAPLCSDKNEVKGCIISLTDISRLKEAERYIDSEREKFKTTLASIGDAVVTTNPDGLVSYLNPVAERLTGWSITEAAGIPVEQVIPIVDEHTHQVSNHPVIEAAHTGRLAVLSSQNALVTRRGTHIPIEDSAAPIRNSSGLVTGVVMVFQDVTEKRKAETSLRKNQERLQMTTAATEIGTWEWDIPSNSLNWDERHRLLFKIPPQAQLDYQIFIKAIHPEDRQAVEQTIQTALEEGNIYRSEYRVVLPDGEIRWMHSRGQALFDEAGKPYQMLGVVMDITERKISEQEIRSNQAQIEVQHRLIEQREQERQQIARDLHDGPVQDLIAATYMLHKMRMESDDPELDKQLVEVQNLVSGQVSELRAYAGQLRPPILSKFGLEKAIKAYLQTFNNKHPDLSINYVESSVGLSLSEETRLACYRIFQEALNNVAKHSQAEHLDIRLEENDTRLMLEIEDDGVGFEPMRDWLQFARTGHLGLVGMRERAEAVGGKITLESKAGEGTLLRLIVPINRQPPNESEYLNGRNL